MLIGRVEPCSKVKTRTGLMVTAKDTRPSCPWFESCHRNIVVVNSKTCLILNKA